MYKKINSITIKSGLQDEYSSKNRFSYLSSTGNTSNIEFHNKTFDEIFVTVCTYKELKLYLSISLQLVLLMMLLVKTELLGITNGFAVSVMP